MFLTEPHRAKRPAQELGPSGQRKWAERLDTPLWLNLSLHCSPCKLMFFPWKEPLRWAGSWQRRSGTCGISSIDPVLFLWCGTETKVQLCVPKVSRPSRGQATSQHLLGMMTSPGLCRVELLWLVLQRGACEGLCASCFPPFKHLLELREWEVGNRLP